MTRFAMAQSLLVNFCALLVIGFPFSSGQTTSKNVICYYHSFVSERSPDFDSTICTHLVYMETWLHDARSMVLYEDSDLSKDRDRFQYFRRSNPPLKILLGVASLLSSYSEVMSATYEKRQLFYDNTINFLRKWDFDGIDVRSTSEAHQEIIPFIEEMREALKADTTPSGKEPLILMLRLPERTEEGVDYHRLGNAVDILQVTLGDDPFCKDTPFTSTGLASPLYGNGGYRGNVSGMITSYLNAGVLPEKLHIGVQLTAPVFTLSNPTLTGVGAPLEGQSQYYCLDELFYKEVCECLHVKGYTERWDPEGLVKFAFKDDQWITYEDPDSLLAKMNYIYEHNLGGVAVEYLFIDNYSGEFCNQGKYPLTSTLYRLASSGNS